MNLVQVVACSDAIPWLDSPLQILLALSSQSPLISTHDKSMH